MTVLVAVGVAFLVYDLPLSPALESPPPHALSLESSEGKSLAFRGVYRGEPVAFGDLPRHLVQAVLAIEDRRFFDHGGVDLKAMLRALWTNLRAGTVRQGGSTITQQYVKLAFLTPERTLRRKVQEALLAIWLESRADKEKIFTLYINEIYFGAGAYGIDAAARRYFGKRAGSLDLAESAMLAGLILAPSRLAPTSNLEAAKQRARIVLQAMVESGFIEQSLADRAAEIPVIPRRSPESVRSAGYFADWAAVMATERLGSVSGDFTLRTTLDLSLQATAETVLREHLEREGDRLGAGQAALVALAPDGAVRAMVGGRDYSTSQFNRATQAQRQPGSLFKLFVALTALRAGFSPESRVVDKPVEVEGWQPRNYTGRYLGPVTLRQAFAKSINSVSVQLTERIGRDAVVRTARDLGITSPLTPHPSLALGTSSVNLLEITAAYGALQAGRPRITPYGIASLSTSGQELYRHAVQPPPGLGHDERLVRRDMLDLLEAVVRVGTGRAADPGEKAAGKTGTSQDYRDAWFVGMTPDLVVGVWVGNDDNAPMKKVTGGTLPAAMWRDFMIRSRDHRQETGASSLAFAGKEEEPDGDESTTGPPLREAAKPNSRDREPQVSESSPPQDLDVDGEGAISGYPEILDVGTLRFDDHILRLTGVRPEGAEFITSLRRYIGDRIVTCHPFDRRTYRCEVAGFDLSEVVIFNGGARSTRDAPPYLRRAESRARYRRLGIWAVR